MSVITTAIEQKILSDSVLTGTKDENSNWNEDGLLSIFGKGSYYDIEQGKWVTDGGPAVFTYEPIPPYKEKVGNKTEWKYQAFIVAAGHSADTWNSPFGSKTTRARDITREIICSYIQKEENDNSYERVEAMAERVYKLFDRQTLTIPDSDSAHFDSWQTVLVRCNGPINLPRGERKENFAENLDQLIVTLNFTIVEKQ